jgi:glycosyltransferase involved in cell wall biosynthesis
VNDIRRQLCEVRQSSSPQFSILLVNHKTLEFTRNCLDTIRECSGDSSYELIVVDNDSNDDSLAYLRDHKEIRLIERRSGLHYGPADHGEALDIGLLYARGEYIVVVDSDVIILRQGWLTVLGEILRKEAAVLIGPSFYCDFIHPCVLMIKREAIAQYRLSFAPQKRFHRYFDTAEYLTHVLMQHRRRIIKLDSWIANLGTPDSTQSIDGTNTTWWVKEGAALAARHGAFIGGLAYHAFYGTRALNSDCDGSLENVRARRIEPVAIKAAGSGFTTSYARLVDHRKAVKRLKDQVTFAFMASNFLVRTQAVNLRDYLCSRNLDSSQSG